MEPNTTYAGIFNAVDSLSKRTHANAVDAIELILRGIAFDYGLDGSGHSTSLQEKARRKGIVSGTES